VASRIRDIPLCANRGNGREDIHREKKTKRENRVKEERDRAPMLGWVVCGGGVWCGVVSGLKSMGSSGGRREGL